MNKGMNVVYAIFVIVALSLLVKALEFVAPITGIVLFALFGGVLVYEIVAIVQGVSERRKLFAAQKERQKQAIRTQMQAMEKDKVGESSNEFIQPIEILAYNYNYLQTPNAFSTNAYGDSVETTNHQEEVSTDIEETPLTTEEVTTEEDMTENHTEEEFEEYDELDDIIFNNFEEPDVGVPIDMVFSDESADTYHFTEVSDEELEEYALSSPNVYQFPSSEDAEYWDKLAEEYADREKELQALERASIESDRLEEEFLKDAYEKALAKERKAKKQDITEPEVVEEELLVDGEQEEQSTEEETEERNQPMEEKYTIDETEEHNQPTKNEKEHTINEAKEQIIKRSFMDKVKGAFGKVNFDVVKQGIADRVSMFENDAKEHLPQVKQALKDVITFAIKRVKSLAVLTGIITLSVFAHADAWSNWLMYSGWAILLLAATFTVRAILYVVFKQKTKSVLRTTYYKLMNRTKTVNN